MPVQNSPQRKQYAGPDSPACPDDSTRDHTEAGNEAGNKAGNNNPNQRAPGNNVADKARGDSTELGGYSGPEPTRYGDWEKNGRCVDF